MGCALCSPVCENKLFAGCCIVFLFLIGATSIVQIFVVTPTVEEAFYAAIEDTIVITQSDQDSNSEKYRDWLDNDNDDSALQLFEYWLYNVTNAMETPNGAVPTFELIGPFAYRRFETKTAPGNQSEPPQFFENNEESIVQYDALYRFEYLPDQSTDIPLEAEVFVLSGAMLGFFNNVNLNTNGQEPFISACVDEALSNYPGTSVYYHTSVATLMTGIYDPWIAQLDEYCADDFLWPFIRPNTFFALHATGINSIIQHTGKKDIQRIGELAQYRNFTTPLTNSFKLRAGDMWLDHTETVEGSRETRQFPPRKWITKQRELRVWSIEKFRATSYVYDHDVSYKGVDLMRFRLSDRELKRCEFTYDNQGNIVNETHTCKYYQYWEDGVANLTNLRGSPSFMSKGRLLDAPWFLNDSGVLFGLPLPERERDDQYFDVDPLSGIVFRNWHSYQINFRMFAMNRSYQTNFTNFTSMFDRLLPFAYVRVEAFATDDQMDFYKSTLDAMDLVHEFSLYGGPVLAVLAFGLMFYVCCKVRTMGYARGFGGLLDDEEDEFDAAGRSDVAMGMKNGDSYGTRE